MTTAPGGWVGQLAGGDYNRFPTRPALADRFKQWVHVAVAGPELSLVANFSALPAASGDAVHRLIVLVHAGDLRGAVRAFAAERCAMPAGRRHMRFGGNELATHGDVHRLVLDEPDLGLRADLVLRELAGASVLHHLPLGGGGEFHWAVIPRLAATGAVEYAGRTHALEGAPAYRDRNWGSFWLGEVAWDWGYVTPASGGAPCAVAFARLMDAARTRVIEQQLLVWWGDRLLASFRDREIGFALEGAFDGARPTIPPALALCRPGRATDVPETATVTGASSRGRIEVRFTRRATARILVPNEARLGTTAIYESFGDAAASGVVSGQDLALAGRGFFECVHA